VDVGAAALQFPLAHPAVATVVAGLRSQAEVDSAAARRDVAIPATLWRRLQDAGLLARDAVLPS
jgi:D-threo-aldose 1-dehydrogenase